MSVVCTVLHEVTRVNVSKRCDIHNIKIRGYYSRQYQELVLRNNLHGQIQNHEIVCGLFYVRLIVKGRGVESNFCATNLNFNQISGCEYCDQRLRTSHIRAPQPCITRPMELNI